MLKLVWGILLTKSKHTKGTYMLILRQRQTHMHNTPINSKMVNFISTLIITTVCLILLAALYWIFVVYKITIMQILLSAGAVFLLYFRVKK